MTKESSWLVHAKQTRIDLLTSLPHFRVFLSDMAGLLPHSRNYLSNRARIAGNELDWSHGGRHIAMPAQAQEINEIRLEPDAISQYRPPIGPS
jgi:hypothetical protein